MFFSKHDEPTTNDTLCLEYIPGIQEYRQALKGLWITYVLVGSVTCVILYSLFFKQVFHMFKHGNVSFRSSVIWISSVYPFMTLLSVIGFVVPKSQDVCRAMKIIYMTIGISHFADLTTAMYGSEEVMLWRASKDCLHTATGPICCCCPCILPNIPVTKVSLRLVLAGCYQLPYTQALYHGATLILLSANEIVMGSVNLDGTYLWLNIFSVSTSLLGVYSLNILSGLSSRHLQRYNYSRKSLALRILIIITKMQSLAFNIMANYGVFPCIPPISNRVYKDTVENTLYIFEMLIFGLFSYHMYHSREFQEPNPTLVLKDPFGNTRAHHPAYLKDFSGMVLGTDEDSLHPDDYLDDQASRCHPVFDFTSSTLVMKKESEHDAKMHIGIHLKDTGSENYSFQQESQA